MNPFSKKAIGVLFSFTLVVAGGGVSYALFSSNNAFKVNAGDPVHPTSAETYYKITDISLLSTGDKIILFNDTEKKEYGVTGYSGSDATTSGDANQWMKFTVTMNTGGNSFKAYSASLGKYITPNASNKFTIAAAESAAAPCFPTDTGVFAYTDTASVNRYLVTNGSYNRCYKSIGSYSPFKIYLVFETPEEELAFWSRNFYKALKSGTTPICKEDGSTNLTDLETEWAKQSTSFGKLSSSAKALATTASSEGETDTAKAMKLYDFIITKYKVGGISANITNFIGRTEVQPKPIGPEPINPNSKMNGFVILTSVVGVSAVLATGLFVAKKSFKKKEHKKEDK